MLFCVECNSGLENVTMSAPTVHCVQLLGMDRVLFVEITDNECLIRNLLLELNNQIL